MTTDNGFTNAETEHAVLMIMNDSETYKTLIESPRLPSWQSCKNAVRAYIQNEFRHDEETREELTQQMASVDWKEVHANVRAKREELKAEEEANKKTVAKGEPCNGYSSYATWVICLHLGNDEDKYNKIMGMRRESYAWKDKPITAKEAKNLCKGLFSPTGPGEIAKDEGRAAWHSNPAIDWQEVADFINDTRKG